MSQVTLTMVSDAKTGLKRRHMETVSQVALPTMDSECSLHNTFPSEYFHYKVNSLAEYFQVSSISRCTVYLFLQTFIFPHNYFFLQRCPFSDLINISFRVMPGKGENSRASCSYTTDNVLIRNNWIRCNWKRCFWKRYYWKACHLKTLLVKTLKRMILKRCCWNVTIKKVDIEK